MIDFPYEASPTASIIVIGLRQASAIDHCLASVRDNVVEVPYEVIVVLSDPTPEAQWRLEREVSGARVAAFKANLGFGGAANYAASIARGDYIVLLNDDCTVQRGWLESLIDTEQRRERCAIVGSTYLHPDGTLQEAGSVIWRNGHTAAVGDGRMPGFMEYERRVDYCSGGSLLVRRDVWDKLGGLDEAFYPAYAEDVDFCLRAAQAGFEVWYQPKSVVVHARSSSSHTSIRSFLFRQAIERLRSTWGEELAKREPMGSYEKAIWKAMGEPLRVLVVDDQLPNRSLGSGMGRMADVLATLDRDPSVSVTFSPRMAPQVTGSEMSPGIRIEPDLESHLEVEGVDYDVVVVSRPHNAEALRELLGTRLAGVPVVYDAEALFHVRMQMQAALAPEEDQEVLAKEAAEMAEREFALAHWADAVVCISEQEAEMMRSHTSSPVHVVEPWFEAPVPTGAGFAERSDIGFVAGWAAGPGAPNCDGLLWFAKEVLPLVRARLPHVRLLVTGYNPPADVSWLSGAAVRFVGGIRELARFYDQVRLTISPTRFGAGVKLKTVESIQYGVPVVSTLEGAAGLTDELREAVWATDDPQEFADAVVTFLSHRPTWEYFRRRAMLAMAGADIEGSGIGTWPRILHATAAGTRRREAV